MWRLVDILAGLLDFLRFYTQVSTVPALVTFQARGRFT